jgi:hypothetical protein
MTGRIMPRQRSALSLLNLGEEKLLQRFVREPEGGRFFQRLVSLPAINNRRPPASLRTLL